MAEVGGEATGNATTGGAVILGRIAEACEFLAFLNPTMAALVRMVPHGPGRGEPAMAWASARRCFYGPAFAAAPLPERIGVVIHEWGHVALGHHGRTRRVARARDGVDAKLMNIAYDLVLNTWIGGIRATTRGAVSLPAGVVDVASLGRAMAEANMAIEESATARRRGIGTVAALAEHAGETVHAVLHEMREAAYPDAVGKLVARLEGPLAGDVLVEVEGEGGEAGEAGDEREGARGATHGLGAMAGSDPWGFASRVLAALPRPRVDWRRQLRAMVLREVGGELEATWSRTSRRQPSHGDVRVAGSRRGETGRPLAVIDTSGSIDDEVIKGFMAECCAIANLTNAPITVMEADVEVHATSLVQPGASRHQPLMDKGRGGTDFTAALKAADALAPSVIVYLTDLVAPEPGYKPKVPVVWCAVGDHPGPSFGRVVRVPGA